MANPYNVAQHINGNSHLVDMRRILRIPQVDTPYPANGTDGHGVPILDLEGNVQEWQFQVDAFRPDRVLLGNTS